MKIYLLLLVSFSSSLFSFAQTWTPLGPSQIPPDSMAQNGLGVMYDIAFHPTDPNTFWIAGSGGLWKTTNNAISWNCLTDHIPVMGAGGVVVNPSFPDSILISGSSIYGNNENGIFRSVNGGLSWDTVSILPAPAPYFYIRNFFMLSNNRNSLIACTNKGIFKSTDAGLNWVMTVAGQFTKCLQNPGHANILYATTYFDQTGNPNKFYRSLDYGNTWTEINHFNTIIYGVDFAVTPANPDLIQFVSVNSMSGLDGLFISNDSGSTITEYRAGNCTNNILGYSTSGNSCGGQAGYDLAIFIDPADQNKVLIAAIYNWKSTDGGATWNLCNTQSVGQGAVHVDKHCLKVSPLTNELYEMNDGGVSRSNDMGITWQNISNTLNNVQIHRIAADYTGPERVLLCQQDNGTKILENNLYRNFETGDGFCAAFDPANPNIYYTSTQNGLIHKTINNGLTWTIYQPTTSFNQPFQTNFMMDPMDHNTLVYVGDQIYMSNNGAVNWSALPNLSFSSGTSQRGIFVSRNAGVRNIYASDWGNLYHTSNDGLNWAMIADTSIGGNTLISSIAVDIDHPNTIWFTMYGHIAGKKVFKSIDGGATWTNCTGSLPNTSVNCILSESNTNEMVFIGTDLGVYYSDSSMSDWAPYNSGLPTVRVYDLSINCTNQNIYAATYGRGLWKTNCNCAVITSTNELFATNSVSVYPNPFSENATLELESSLQGKMKVSFYDAFGKLIYVEESEDRNISLDKNKFGSGLILYRVSIDEKILSTGKFIVN